MTDSSSSSAHDRCDWIYQSLCERFAPIGIALWHCDAQGNVLREPDSPAECLQWLRSPALRQSVESAARRESGKDPMRPVEISPGAWIIPLEQGSGVRRTAVFAALLLSEQASAPVPARHRFSDREIARLHQFLLWSRDELSRARRDAQTIEQFGDRLAQAYEETNLLYRMARLLNSGDVCQALLTIGTELQQILPFGWLVLRFAEQGQGVKELAGKVAASGQPPCGIEQVLRLSDAMLSHRDVSKGWTRILEPDRDPLAAATGAQVLVEPIRHDDRVIGLLMAGNKQGPDRDLSSFEMQFLDATARLLGVFHENLARFVEQRELFMGTLRALTAAIDAKDRYTRGHSERVALLATKMAQDLRMETSDVEQYRIAGLVHDVGKIGVPEAVLCKPARLTAEEFALIKLHPAIGYEILKGIPALQPILPGVLCHHERWDGRGYPNGLCGDSIPLVGRVLALADTFDAMSSNRAYRPALPRDKVLCEIRACGGSQFDPALAPRFAELDFADFDQLLMSHKSLEQRAA